jgi:hypothetical protein
VVGDRSNVVLLQLSSAVVDCLVDAAATELITPKSWASQFFVDISPAPADEDVAIEPSAISSAAPRCGKRLPGKDYALRTPTFEIECVQLAWHLNNISDIESVCVRAARIMMPDLDTTVFPFLKFEAVRESIVKLDLMHMLPRRVFCKPLDPRYRTMRQICPDSSPQGNYDYLCMIEELMRRPLPLDISIDMDPLAGFMWELRSTPLQTIGKKHSSVAAKLNRVIASVTMENGPENMTGWRLEVKGFLPDQGSGERGIPKAPYGSPDDVMDVLRDIKHFGLTLDSDRVQNMTFLMNSLDQPGALHLFGNATEHALKSVDEWSDYELKLSAVAKALGEPDNKKLLLATIFRDARSDERHCIHKFPNGIVDHKWEHMEDLHEHVVDCFPILRKYWQPTCLPDTTLGPIPPHTKHERVRSHVPARVLIISTGDYRGGARGAPPIPRTTVHSHRVFRYSRDCSRRV